MIGGLKLDTRMIICIILGVLALILLILVILFGVAYSNGVNDGVIVKKEKPAKPEGYT